MLKINKVTTKTGDKGTTLGPGLKQTGKDSCLIEFLGYLDSTNCTIGKSLLYLKTKKTRKIFETIGHQLFEIGAMFFKENTENCEKLIEFLERNITEYNKNLKELRSFLLPQGNNLIIALNEARCMARHCERVFWKTQKTELAQIGIYLNRLSDFIFIIIRKYNKKIWLRQF